MSHPKELIERIRGLLEKDYPSASYRYVIEQHIIGNTSMFPDIQVFSGDVLLCVVEIGYTRPEKLTAYRERYKVPDVRWYDKQGNLHTPLDRKSTLVQVSVSASLAKPTSMFCIYEAWERVPCNCLDSDHEALSDEEDYIAVCTWTVTDGVSGVLLCWCDKCGKSWIDRESCLFDLREDFTDPSQVMRDGFERIFRGSWDDCMEFVRTKTEYDEPLCYDDLTFLSDDTKEQVDIRLEQLRKETECTAATP